jgi:hypothetical protein
VAARGSANILKRVNPKSLSILILPRRVKAGVITKFLNIEFVKGFSTSVNPEHFTRAVPHTHVFISQWLLSTVLKNQIIHTHVFTSHMVDIVYVVTVTLSQRIETPKNRCTSYFGVLHLPGNR